MRKNSKLQLLMLHKGLYPWMSHSFDKWHFLLRKQHTLRLKMAYFMSILQDLGFRDLETDF